MRRTLPLYLLLSLLLGGFAGYVWLSYNPRAAVLERATTWPLVGPWAHGLRTHLQERYLGGETPTGVDGADTDPAASTTLYLYQEEPQLPPAQETHGTLGPLRSPDGLPLHQWLPDGSLLYAQPDTTGPTVTQLGHAQPLALLGRDGSWLHLRYRGRSVWVPAPNGPPLGQEPAPVLPVPGLAPNPEHLATARRLLGSRAKLRELGPYPLHTDVEDPDLLSLLNYVGHQLPKSYRNRYGVYPRYPAAETAILFAEPDDYRAYLSSTPDLAHLDPNGHVGDGLLVVAVGRQGRRQVAGTVIHEMAHLINRRAIGPALPSWLDEGLAEDLSYGYIDRDATYHADRLEPAPELRAGTTVRFEGVHAAVQLLLARRAEGRAPSIERLVQIFDFKQLEGERALLAYATSGLFVRFLLDGGDVRLHDGLHAFLAAVAQGEPPTGEALRQRLGVSWAELDARFGAWLQTVG